MVVRVLATWAPRPLTTSLAISAWTNTWDKITLGVKEVKRVIDDTLLYATQTRGKHNSPQIYLEATCFQDPGLEAHLVKTASNCSISSCCLSRHKLEAVTNNATIAHSCLQLDWKLKMAFNCSKRSCCLSSWRPEAAFSIVKIADICLQSFNLLQTAA